MSARILSSCFMVSCFISKYFIHLVFILIEQVKYRFSFSFFGGGLPFGKWLVPCPSLLS